MVHAASGGHIEGAIRAPHARSTQINFDRDRHGSNARVTKRYSLAVITRHQIWL